MNKIFLILPLGLILFLCIHKSAVAQENKVVDQIVAVVGGKVILLSEIENQHQQLKAQGYESASDMKCEILEDLLYQKLLINQAELDSIEVTHKEVEDALDSRFRYFISQIGSVEKLEEYFNKTIVEMKEDFRQDIKDQLLSQKMQSKITEEVKITPSEVRNFFKDIPQDSIPFINTEIELAHIMINPKISDEEKELVKERLKGFRDRIMNGDKFTTIAVLYSEDPGSSKNGGELGLVSRKDLVPEFAAVAFNLQENEVSRIVETQYGYHVIQLIEKRGEMVNVRHILLTPKVSIAEKLRVKQKLDSIASAIRNNSITFEEAAEKYSEDNDTKFSGGNMFNPYNGTSKFETNQLDPSTYYAINSLKINEISNTIEAKDLGGKSVYKIVKLKSKSIPHKANLTDDYQRIQDLAMENKKQDIINKWTLKQRASTYIQIDKSYINCNFRLAGWGKN
ncbi:MAG TPA: peptidylprolyl isomerase [Bacteroidales bacterium]|nr:MAG: hypothetical protein A2W98_04390 [Bacteroidetes bacterium GWF2_33_38]HBF88991.1 peptidylprolyl isomerase [Bacteroidales bacterium]